MYITYHITVQQKLTHCKSTLLELKKNLSLFDSGKSLPCEFHFL